MSDEDVRLVLQRAAQDDAFRKALLDDRDATVDGLELPPHEKAMLKSASRAHLERMIFHARARQPRRFSTLGKAATGIGIAALGAAVALPLLLSSPTTMGLRSSETSPERHARFQLGLLAHAQQLYRDATGTYGTLDDLRGHETTKALVGEYSWEEHPYEFTITTDGETFIATARHKKRPQTRKAFVVRDDGTLRELEEDDEPAASDDRP